MLHVVIDYDSPERLEVQSSSPDFLREKVEDAIFLALGTEPFTIRTGSDWIIRELNARIMLHELPRPERDALMEKYGVKSTISARQVRCDKFPVSDTGITVPFLDKEIVRLNGLCREAYFALENERDKNR